MTLLEEIAAKLESLPADTKAAVAKQTTDATAHLRWIPSPGPQTDAYFSLADVLLYGGEPGGGKSQLILGLAFNCHERSLIMRRQYADLDRLIEDALRIHGSRDGFNGSPPPRLRVSERQIINFRAAQRIGDEQGTMGQGRDLLGIDEATHFAESQVRFLMGWVRTETPGQRCRTVLASNPPLTAEGLWVNAMFAPWLDPNHPRPAKAGELRWVVSDEDGRDEWVDGPGDVRSVRGKVIRPVSRTFIPASVKDNPYYAASDYERTLDALPEPFRSQLLGGFRTTFKDHEKQVIPTAWIEEAQLRWRPDGWKDFAMTAMAVDPAGGGQDAAVICWRHGGWFAPFVSIKGPETADGSVMAGRIVGHRRDGCPVVIESGGGYGGAIAQRLKDNSINAVAYNGANSTQARTHDRAKLGFYNKRAEVIWRFREELNPDQEGGAVIALPPDPELKADLAAFQWDLTVRGIKIESKDDIRDRLGRSPGKGDAAVICMCEGATAIKREMRTGGGRMPEVRLGHAHLKKRR